MIAVTLTSEAKIIRNWSAGRTQTARAILYDQKLEPPLPADADGATFRKGHVHIFGHTERDIPSALC